MGEWTIHIDAPEGTLLEGSSEITKNLGKELGGIDGIAQLEPTITDRPTHIHLLGYALPFDERKATQGQMVAELRRRLRAHPSYKPSISIRNPLGGGEAGGFPIPANPPGPRLGPPGGDMPDTPGEAGAVPRLRRAGNALDHFHAVHADA